MQAVTEQHPLATHGMDLPLERRVQLLEIYLTQLWDEVWWHQLPWHRRWWYTLQGFRSPIQQFYVTVDGR